MNQCRQGIKLVGGNPSARVIHTRHTEETEEKPEESEESEELKLSEDEDELELAKIPERQEIKKAFPDLFKKFPALEHA